MIPLPAEARQARGTGPSRDAGKGAGWPCPASFIPQDLSRAIEGAGGAPCLGGVALPRHEPERRGRRCSGPVRQAWQIWQSQPEGGPVPARIGGPAPPRATPGRP